MCGSRRSYGRAATGVPVWQQWQTTPKEEGVEGPGVMESFAPEQNRTAADETPPWIE